MAPSESVSPSGVVFPSRVRSPSKESNGHAHASGHPYPIKTTSTAILSRSNSFTSRRPQLPLVYTPSSSPNPKPLGRSQSRGHGRANSLSSVSPQPLPLPSKRKDSLSEQPPTPNPEAIAQLPDNPKQWSPSQLSIYLSSALRFKGGAAIPAPVAKDIAAFALREKLTGKAFLRLRDENLVAMGVNQLWREALLAASRTLRKKVLKGRIWGFGSPLGPDDPEHGTPIESSSSKRRIPSTVDEEESDRSPPPSAGFRMGRVRGIVDSLERSGSSNGSGGSDEVDVENQALDDERMENELRAAGLWIGDEPDADDDLAGNLSASASSSSSAASSDNEMVEDFHFRNSSGSQPPTYSRATAGDGLEEPSIEQLLVHDSSFVPPSQKKHSHGWTFEEAPSVGAMAWERDQDIVGGTAKKVVPAQAPRPIKPGVINGTPQPTVLDIFGTSGPQESFPSTELKAARDDASVLLEVFKARLEATERKLKELEVREEEREKELVRLRENEKRRVVEEEEEERRKRARRSTIDLSPELDPYATVVDEDDPVDIPWPRPVRQPSSLTKAITPLAIPSGENKHPITEDLKPAEQKEGPKVGKEVENDSGEGDPPLEPIMDPTPSELPAYVLLVSLGVATVVARVLFRRMGGERRL